MALCAMYIHLCILYIGGVPLDFGNCHSISDAKPDSPDTQDRGRLCWPSRIQELLVLGKATHFDNQMRLWQIPVQRFLRMSSSYHVLLLYVRFERIYSMPAKKAQPMF